MSDTIGIHFLIEKSLKNELDEFCDRNGFSLTGFAVAALRERLERLRGIEAITPPPRAAKRS